jgi:DNA-binding MarR family transcriptional regulator
MTEKRDGDEGNSTIFYQDESLEDINLAAAFRRGFRQALVLMNRALASHNLSPLQYHLLLEAGAAGSEGLVQGDLADLLQTPEARVSVLVHDLAERGLVATSRGAPDRRLVRVGITQTGCSLVQDALHSQRAALTDLARGFEAPGVADMLNRALKLYLDVDLEPETAQAVG